MEALKLSIFLCKETVDDIEKIIDLISNKDSYWKYSTPLHLACESGCVDVVDCILSKKEFAKKQINSLNCYSQRPIDCAIQNGSIGCVKLLVEKGKVNLFIHKRRHVPLVDADIVSYIEKQKNAEINGVDSKNVNAFTAALINDHFNVVKILIENVVADELNEYELNVAFLKACQLNNMKVVKYLDENQNIPYKTMGHLFMNQAILIENKILNQFLIDKKCIFENVNI